MLLISPNWGTTFTLPSDWNPANNRVECIGAGQTGGTGYAGVGAQGGFGGDYAAVINWNVPANTLLHISIGSPGAAWNAGSLAPFGGNTWISTTTVAPINVSQGAFALGGAQSGSSIGNITYDGGLCGFSNPSPTYYHGGGGGGAAGPNGDGRNGFNSTGGFGDNTFGGAGGTGSIGGGTSGGDGTEYTSTFDSTTAGSGGGGGGDHGLVNGGDGGLYGGGGGGGGWDSIDVAGSPGGAGQQGVIILTYDSIVEG